MKTASREIKAETWKVGRVWSYRISSDAHRSLVNAFCLVAFTRVDIFACGLSASQPGSVLAAVVFSFCKEGVVLNYHLDCSRAPYADLLPQPVTNLLAS